MQKPQLVAVDTNILLRLAEAHEATLDAWQLIKRWLNPVQFLVSPTVLGELANQMLAGSSPLIRNIAQLALRQLRSQWHFQPVEFNGVQEVLSDNAAQKLRHSGLIPYQERNDALIVLTQPVLDCILLVSRDSHLLEIDFQ